MSTLQLIYYGAPGTGKSYVVDKQLKELKIEENQIFRVTFHPEYTYSDFTGQLLPVVKDDEITYDYQRGIFTNALRQAYNDLSKPVFLIIEEMSRGNVAAIFGDIFQLLDRNDKNVSRYPIRNSVIAKEIPQIDDNNDVVKLPANFNILGTVNTSDQNVFVMDTAFKRRFDWRYISTDPVRNKDGTLFEEDNVLLKLKYGSREVETNWHEFYMKLNSFITDRRHGLGLSEDKQIGQFFIQFSKKMPQEIIEDKIKNKLIQYLWDDVESASYGTTVKLFNEEITNYSDLYRAMEKEKQFFSDTFLTYFEALELPDGVL